ncbi:hypothetical protein BGZ52_004669 [Haplosporangium bisporale]|nr:hypothetical protein BGZ52_004669 [Haplosporangium bisporale]
MSKALDPLKRLVGSLNARFACFRAFPANTLPAPPQQPHLHHSHNTSAGASAAAAIFKQPAPTHFQVKVALPVHRDGPLLLNVLHSNFDNLAKRVLLPEPARVAAVNYACQNAGRPPMASLLSATSHRMMHHQPLAFSVPRGFAKNVGLSSSRGFCSVVGTTNGPVRMMAQMYAKPLGALSAHANKKTVDSDNAQHKRLQRKHRGGEVKKRASTRPARLSTSTIKAFLTRAALVEQQHQMLTVCNAATLPITTAAAISMAKVVGKTVSELNELKELPKLHASDECPTNVDMCFMLDASPLWHLDTMVSALHTDSLRAPKQLNGGFIEDLLEITEYQYQHFLEVSTILQRLVQCPQAREISLDGYELRVHFTGTTLFDMAKFLLELGIDPKSPHFDLEEIYVDASTNQYFPQASVNGYYYASSLMSEDTWDDCSSLQTSLIYADSEFNASAVSLAEIEPLPVQHSPWEEAVAPEKAPSEVVDIEQKEAMTLLSEIKEDQAQRSSEIEHEDAIMVETALNVEYPTEDPWTQPQSQPKPSESREFLYESTLRLGALSSQILGSAQVTDEYFDSIRGFLDGIEAVHRHADKLYSH